MKATTETSNARHGRGLVLASLLAGWLISMVATTAHADALAKPTDATAREHLSTGNRYYRLREFEKAIEEYKAGAVKEDAPVFYYNLGQCYRQLGRYEEAIWHYERFLERGTPTGEVEVAVKKFIAQMRDELGKAAMKQPPVEPAPPSAPNSTSAEHPLPPIEHRRGMPLQRKLAIGVGAAGSVSLALGVVFGLRASSFQDDADATCPMSTCDRADDANKLIDRGKTNALYANVAFGIGGAALVGGAVLWIIGAPREHPAMMIAPQVSRSFTGVTTSMRF